MVYPDTSRSAWEMWGGSEVSGELDRRIMQVIAEHHPHGIICEHIEVAIGAKHQSVSGNLCHLKEKGFAVDSGRRGLTRSGREAIMWVLSTPMSIEEERRIVSAGFWKQAQQKGKRNTL